jgi:hypothetical protein
MPTLTFKTRYRKNEDMVISPEELLTIYFFSVGFDSKDGSRIDDNVTRMYIRQAQLEIEKYLDIKLFPKLVTETLDYHRDDFSNGFPTMQCSYPVRVPRSLLGYLNGVEQIVYPEEWLTSKTTNVGAHKRLLSVVPNGSVVNGDAGVILTGVSSYYGLRSYDRVPNYWTVQYETGLDVFNFPEDILQLVGLLASIPLFAIAGDIILGAGIASQSLGVDGLSQSISTTSSATNAGYGSRVIEYRKSVDATKKILKSYYGGIRFTVC